MLGPQPPEIQTSEPVQSLGSPFAELCVPDAWVVGGTEANIFPSLLILSQ